MQVDPDRAVGAPFRLVRKISRKPDIGVGGFARDHRLDLLFDGGQGPAFAQNQLVRLGLARLTGSQGRQGDLDQLPGFGPPGFHRYPRRLLLPQVLELGSDRFVGHRRHPAGQREASQSFEFDVGFDLDVKLEREG